MAIVYDFNDIGKRYHALSDGWVPHKEASKIVDQTTFYAPFIIKTTHAVVDDYGKAVPITLYDSAAAVRSIVDRIRGKAKPKGR